MPGAVSMSAAPSVDRFCAAQPDWSPSSTDAGTRDRPFATSSCDSVVVVVNLSAQGREDQRVGLPSGGLWTLRFNSDAPSYSALFGHAESFDLEAHDEGADGLDFHGNVTIAPYSVLIYSQGA